MTVAAPMSRQRPEPDCRDLAFQGGYRLPEPAQVALEDYARVLTRSRGAESIRPEDDLSVVTGVHVCGPGTTPEPQTVTDLEDFARDMAIRGPGGGLGWS